MTDKEKTGRVLISTQARQTGETCDSFSVDVDLGNFVSNTDELVHLQLEECTPIMLASQANPISNIFNSIEIQTTIPQFNSYDTFLQNQCIHMCYLDRNVGQVQTVESEGPLVTNYDNPETWQVWDMKHKPNVIIVRPEVFQHKRWYIQVKFFADAVNRTVLGRYGAATYMSDFAMVFSVTK